MFTIRGHIKKYHNALHHFLMLIIGWIQIELSKQITQKFLVPEVEDVQIVFIMRWTFVILMNLVDVVYAINLVITEEIVQILNQNLMQCKLCNILSIL